MTANPWGRPPKYPFKQMAIGDQHQVPAPTPADVKRICSNASQSGIRNDKFFRCRLDYASRVMTIERVR